MRKALIPLLFLCVLINTCLTHAMVVPREAMAATSICQNSKFNINDYKGNSLFSKDITISDWEESDESDLDNTASRKATAVVCAAKENALVDRHIFKVSKVEVYTDLNFSRLPRHNYISLRVLRI